MRLVRALGSPTAVTLPFAVQHGASRLRARLAPATGLVGG